MFKIKIFSIGKTKESWLLEALEEYQKRLRNLVAIEWILAKDNPQLLSLTNSETHLICLDPKGHSLDSEQFSALLIKKLEESGSRLSFVIGGAEGLPPAIRNNREAISLSPLTFTHQIARLILMEQIYRAFEIAKGTGYHK